MKKFAVKIGLNSPDNLKWIDTPMKTKLVIHLTKFVHWRHNYSCFNPVLDRQDIAVEGASSDGEENMNPERLHNTNELVQRIISYAVN